MKRTRGEAERIMRQVTAQKRVVIVNTISTRYFVDPRSKRQMKGFRVDRRRETIVPRPVRPGEI